MPKKRWVLIAALLFFLFACGSVLSQERGRASGRRPRREVKHPPIGQVLKDFTLQNVKGKPVKLSDYQGKIFIMELGACT
jgi:cytochrome oxidase Cu insertion factor (SCO1/SenC/PrrC family)